MAGGGLKLLVDNGYCGVLYLPSDGDVTVYYLQKSVAILVPTLPNHGERKTWRKNWRLFKWAVTATWVVGIGQSAF
jgi:hypothetical protein